MEGTSHWDGMALQTSFAFHPEVELSTARVGPYASSSFSYLQLLNTRWNGGLWGWCADKLTSIR